GAAGGGGVDGVLDGGEGARAEHQAPHRVVGRVGAGRGPGPAVVHVDRRRGRHGRSGQGDVVVVAVAPAVRAVVDGERDPPNGDRTALCKGARDRVVAVVVDDDEPGAPGGRKTGEEAGRERGAAEVHGPCHVELVIPGARRRAVDVHAEGGTRGEHHAARAQAPGAATGRERAPADVHGPVDGP